MGHFIPQVFAQDIYNPSYDPKSVSDSIFVFKMTWFLAGAAFLVFFVLCFLRVRNTMLALRYSVWLFIAAAAVYGAVSYTNFSSTTQSQADVALLPHNVRVLPLSDSEAAVAWDTDKPLFEFIVYKNADGSDMIMYDNDSYTPTIHHQIRISGLSRGIHYPFKIQFADTQFDQAEGQNFDIYLP